jgi:hypothetical protein
MIHEQSVEVSVLVEQEVPTLPVTLRSVITIVSQTLRIHWEYTYHILSPRLGITL